MVYDWWALELVHWIMNHHDLIWCGVSCFPSWQKARLSCGREIFQLTSAPPQFEVVPCSGRQHCCLPPWCFGLAFGSGPALSSGFQECLDLLPVEEGPLSCVCWRECEVHPFFLADLSQCWPSPSARRSLGRAWVRTPRVPVGDHIRTCDDRASWPGVGRSGDMERWWGDARCMVMVGDGWMVKGLVLIEALHA